MRFIAVCKKVGQTYHFGNISTLRLIWPQKRFLLYLYKYWLFENFPQKIQGSCKQIWLVNQVRGFPWDPEWKSRTESGPARKIRWAQMLDEKTDPQELTRWASSTHANRTLDRKVAALVISRQSLSRRCSGSTHTTCHWRHSLISSARRSPVFLASVKVSAQ